MLYQKGAKVNVACCDEVKASDAISRMQSEGGSGELIFGQIPLNN